MTRTIRRLAQVALQYTGAASHQQQAARISHLGAAATQASSHLQQSLTSAWASPTSPAASSSTAPLASPLALHQRFISSSACVAHGGGDKSSSTESISVTYVEKDGSEKTVRAPIGDNLLHVAHENEIDLEGACEGSLACSTCHVIIEDEKYYERLPEPTDDELDMLDLAYGLTETSRLGCQVIAAKDLDGLKVRIPAASRNFYVDGHKPKPH